VAWSLLYTRVAYVRTFAKGFNAYMKTLQEARMSHIRKVLRHTHGDLEQAGRILGVSPGTLRSLIKEQGPEIQGPPSKRLSTPNEE
jgi:DNA-binding NtrC family response regulator